VREILSEPDILIFFVTGAGELSDDIGKWLEQLGLAEHAVSFVENGVDMALLSELDNDDLKDLGVSRLADRKRLLKAISDLHEGETVAAPSEAPADIPPPSAAPDAERRQVSILFADISGYTRLSSEIDAERMHEILGDFFDRADAIVRDHGGRVDKHVGDSVMAVFGAPVSHSDDPARAARAALAIHEIMPAVSQFAERSLQVHVGIASGQVVASGVGHDAHYTVTGESVNLASRLTDMAGPGETLMSEDVKNAIGDHFVWDNRGEFHAKGIAEKVRAFALRGLHSETVPGSERPFVGRRAEIQQFSSVLTTCLETGEGQAVYLRGEAGIGKTRLREEFERLARERGFACHRALVLDFGVGKGQDAIRTLVRGFLGIPSGGGKEDRNAAASRALSDGLLDEANEMFLNDLLDLPQPQELHSLYDAMDNAKRNQGKRETLVALVAALCKRQPLLLVIEDVHWASGLILEHLAEINRVAAELPAILVMSSRIEGDPLSQSWRAQAGSTPMITIDLGPLRHDDAMTLAAEFFDASSKFAETCVERAEGNPLFLEQLLRSTQTAGEAQVPGSVQSIVQARMDALEGADKQALQAASVLGQRFTLEPLRHLIDEPDYECDGLIERYLVKPEGDQFLFAHALVQEGIYASLLTARRSELHRKAAAWYREQDLVLSAEHLDRAGDPAAAAAYLEAARAQADVLRFEAVLSLAARGIGLAADPDTKCDLMCLRGDALRDQGATDDSIAAFQAGLESASDDARRCRAWIGVAAGLRIADRQESALEALDNAEALASKLGLLSERAQIHYLRGNVYFPLGDIDGCLEQHRKSIEFAREAGSSESEALALGGLGDAYYLRGHMHSAFEQFRACVNLCKENGYGRVEVANRHMMGWSRIHLLELAEALEDALEAGELATKVSHHRAEVLSRMLAGHVLFEFGRIDDALEHLHRGLALARRISTSNFEAQILTHLAHLEFTRGDMSSAREYAKQAIAVLRDVGMTFIGPYGLAVSAEVAADASERHKALEEGEELLEAGCVAHNQMLFAKIAIDVALGQGEWQEAERYASRLEAYTRDQPMAWPDFIIARGRALAAWGRGTRSEELKEEICRLREQAQQAGLVYAIPKLEHALEAA
jgi:class 3 adenylate cyclase